VRHTLALVVAFAATLGFAPAVKAQTPEQFYTGKDVRVLIGAGVGGTYSLYAQLAARHMRQYIPGKPNVVMQAMPGAGGLVGLNYSFNIAPKDGTLMHLVHAEVLYESLLNKDAKFNAQDYQWIGRFADADSVVLMTRRSAITTLEDASKREVNLGATGISNVYALGPLMLNRLSKTRFKIIGGYPGQADISLAMERGELDGSGMTVANAVSTQGEKLKSGDIIPLFAIAARRLTAYPDIPAMTEFGTGPAKTLMEIYASAGTIGRALAFPPGTPPDRVAAFREAFQKTINDPVFQDEVSKANILISTMSGQELSAEINRILQTPASDIAAARALHEELLQAK
jgi:tripartite-type tricarboxylate transporter receptor subunit TctC